MNSVLLLDIDGSNRAAIIRGLNKEGLTVHGTRCGTSVTRYSRYLDTVDQLDRPDVADLLDGNHFYNSCGGIKINKFKKQFMNILHERNPDVIIPYPEEYVLALSYLKDEIKKESDSRIPLPEFSDVLDAVNKSRTVKRAKKNGMVVPNSYFPEDRDDIKEIFQIEETPIVIRPSVDRGGNGVHYCTSVEDGIKAFDNILPYSDPLAQEYVEGKDFTGDLIADQSHRLINYFISEEVLTASPSGGAGIYSITCDNKAVKTEYKKIPEAFDWVGPACPEYIVDVETGEAKLMEINPRMSGHTPLGIKVGVNTPCLFAKVAEDKNIDCSENYKLGVTWWNPKKIYRSGQFGELNMLNIINKWRKNEIFQSRYFYDDPLYSILMFGADLKSVFK